MKLPQARKLIQQKKRLGGPSFRLILAKGGEVFQLWTRAATARKLSRVMPWGLKRYQQTRHLHFITFTCYHRAPLLRTANARDVFEQTLERVRRWYEFVVVGYVVMPEHVHLLVGEPERGSLALAVQMLKQVSARRLLTHPSPKEGERVGHSTHPSPKAGERVGHPHQQCERVGHPPLYPFWQARYYDFNVWSEKKRIEKLRYMHRNPVRRGLVDRPEDWAWSSFRHYASGLDGVVEIGSEWTAWKRRQAERRNF